MTREARTLVRIAVLTPLLILGVLGIELLAGLGRALLIDAN